MAAMEDNKINKLINWGYAKSDAAIRGYFIANLTKEELENLNIIITPPKIPFPNVRS